MIRSKSKVVGLDIADKVQAMRGQWAGHIARMSNTRGGQDNIRMDTQRRKASKKKT